jgi:hypothetical protein
MSEPMLLSELFGDDSHKITEEELAFFLATKSLWSKQFDKIVCESEGPKAKTRIYVKKKKRNNG